VARSRIGTSGSDVRLQKFLSRAGASSRREGERLIEAGRVRVNGEVVTELGTRIDPEQDRVELDGRPVELSRPRWILLHKPAGVLTTADDPGGGPIVYDLLPDDAGALRYVGRLDRETEGLLLFTNQGDVLHRLTHPSFEIEREYRVEARSAVSADALRRLTAGVTLDDGPARARRAWSPANAGEGVVHLILTEGRNREVRRMMQAVGLPVARLVRVRYGPVRLGGLEPGRWRELSSDEIKELRRTVGGPSDGGHTE